MHQMTQLCPKDWLGCGINLPLTLFLFGCIGRVYSSPIPNYKLLVCDRQNRHISARFSKSARAGIGRLVRFPIRPMILIFPSLLGNIGRTLWKIPS